MTIFKDPDVSQAELKRIYRYDAATGIFYWCVDSAQTKKGDVAGCYKTKHKYPMLRLAERLVMAHRAAWLYHYGRWPSTRLDHCDGNRTNNRINNLREASDSQNSQNMKIHVDNVSGYKGVYLHSIKKSIYGARIYVDGRNIKLGCSKSAEICARKYDEAARKHYGEFARLNFPNPTERGVR